MSESLLLLAGDIERNPGPGGIGQENQPQDCLVDDSKQGKKEPKGRQRKPETWKKNSRKIKRAKGEAYINTRGVLVPAIKPPSPERICRCTFQCADVTAEQKASLFRELHSKPYNEQQAMISELVEVHDVRRHYRGRRARESAASRRQRTPWYYLRDGARGRVRVCQGTVCDALGISRVRLQALYRKKAAGLPIEDQRGKHANRPTRGLRGAKPRMKRARPAAVEPVSGARGEREIEAVGTSLGETDGAMTLKELLNTTFGPRGDCGRTAHGAPPAAGLVQGYALPGRHGVTAADGSGFVSQEVGECSRRLPATAGNHHARHYLQSGDAAWHYSGGDALAGVHFPQRVPALYGAHQGFTPAPEVAPWSSHYQQNSAAHGELQAPVNQHLKLFNVDQAAFPVYASVGGQPAFGAVQRPSVTGYVTSAPLNMSIGSLAGVEIYATSQCDSHIANLSAHEELKPMIEKNEIFKPRRRREVKQKNEPKKRERKPETWKRNISKLRKARGEAYENSRGVLVPAVKPPSAEKVCKCNNLQCCEVPLAQKAALFNEFHSKTYNEQQAMIAALVDVRDVKRRYRKGALYREAAASRRQRTPLYYLWNSVGERVRVCMGTVCDALGISRVRLQALYRKKAAGLPIEDQRGKHANRPRRTKRGGGGATNVGSGSPWPSLDRGRTGSPSLPSQSKDVAAKERLTLQELLHYRSSSNIQQSVRCGRSRTVKSGVLAAAPHSEVERKDCGEASAIDAFAERASDEMMLSELLSSTFEPPN